MHLWLYLELIIHQELLDFRKSKEYWEAALRFQDFLRVVFLRLSQFGLRANDANPVEVAFLLLTQIVQGSIQKCRVCVALYCVKLALTCGTFLESVRKHVANM